MLIIKFIFILFIAISVGDAAVRQKKQPTKVVKIKKEKQKEQKTEVSKNEEKQEPINESNILEPYGVEVDSTHALLVDCATGKVLLEKNADQQIEPASMTKILTAYMVMKALKEGRIKPDSMVTISSNALKVEKCSSTMFLQAGDQVKIEDLLKGLIVVSGNDAAVAISEFLGGTQSAFSADMTHLAKEMGCTQTNYKNASGLPDDGHLTTARDIYIMSKRILEDFPEWYGIHKQLKFAYRGVEQDNRNLLLSKNIGCDGIKTGHTSRAGFGMSASAVQNGRRLFLVVAGLKSLKQRAEEAYRLLQWGFTTYGNYTIAPKDEAILELPVRYRAFEKAEIVPKNHVLIMHKNRADQTKATIKYQTTLVAPLKAGDQVGEVVVTHPDMKDPVVIPLVVKKDIERSFFLSRISQTILYIFGK